MAIPLIIFATSLAGIVLLFILKILEIRQRRKMVLGYLSHLADKNIVEGIKMITHQGAKLKKTFDPNTLKYSAQLILALGLKGYIWWTGAARKKAEKMLHRVLSSKNINSTGKEASTFITDILEHKNGFRNGNGIEKI